jgi:hypothetical protein
MLAWLRPRGLGVLVIALGAAALPRTATGQESAPPCGACVVVATTAADVPASTPTDLSFAVVIPATVSDDALTTDLTSLFQARPAAIVIDAREAGTLTGEALFRLRTVATTIRAVRDTPLGVELVSSQVDAHVEALAGYVEFVVLPPEADASAVASQLPGTAVWTDEPSVAPASALEIVMLKRLPRSERLLVRVPADGTDLRTGLRELRDVLPSGLTPLADVRVTCDAPCEAAVYLNPETLDAVAVVQPRQSVTHVAVAPTASALAAFGNLHARSSGPQLEFPATAAPFVLQIRGWRGTTEGAFATGVQVSGSRQLTVEEIIARHQAVRARQERTVNTLISTGTTVLTFQVPGFPGPLTVTARTTVFSGGGQTDVEQQQIRVNGLDLPRSAGQVPKLPLIEPERVSAPPLTIMLNEAYDYSLSGRDRVGGRDAYVVSFTPRESPQTRFSGHAWIDTQTFAIVKTDATQTALRGPIASSREIDEYTTDDQKGASIALLHRAEIFQVYVGPTVSTPIHRVVSLDSHEVNAPDFPTRLAAALQSDAVVLRDTPQGYRFLVPQRGEEPRTLAPSTRDHVATAVVGSLFDPNISVPLVFAGVSYVDFNLLKTGTQLNVFFGGTYGRLSWATRPFLGNRVRVAGDASGVAVSYNDRAFRGGVEHYEENVHQRPAQVAAAIVGTLTPVLRVRAGYELGYTRYTRSESTAPTFLVPASTPVHTGRIALEAESGPWSANAWASVSRRQDWRPWGLTPSSDQLDTEVFERYGASLARSIVWSPRSVAHVEMAWMTGSRLDRFSQFTFGAFDNPLRGYPSVSIRYNTGAAIRSVATWTPTARVRLDGFADVGIARRPDEARLRAYPGFGAAIEAPAPFGWLVAAEWGYGVRGVNTNGSIGTHVFRITGYKMF